MSTPQSESDIRTTLRLDEFAVRHPRLPESDVFLDFDRMAYTRAAVSAALMQADDPTVQDILKFQGQISVHNGRVGHGNAGGMYNILDALQTLFGEDQSLGLTSERLNRILQTMPVYREEHMAVQGKTVKITYRRDDDSPNIFIEAKCDAESQFHNVIMANDENIEASLGELKYHIEEMINRPVAIANDEDTEARLSEVKLRLDKILKINRS